VKPKAIQFDGGDEKDDGGNDDDGRQQQQQQEEADSRRVVMFSYVHDQQQQQQQQHHHNHVIVTQLPLPLPLPLQLHPSKPVPTPHDNHIAQSAPRSCATGKGAHSQDRNQTGRVRAPDICPQQVESLLLENVTRTSGLHAGDAGHMAALEEKKREVARLRDEATRLELEIARLQSDAAAAAAAAAAAPATLYSSAGIQCAHESTVPFHDDVQLSNNKRTLSLEECAPPPPFPPESALSNAGFNLFVVGSCTKQ
jgi:hypothetical protein